MQWRNKPHITTSEGEGLWKFRTDFKFLKKQI